MKTLFKKELKYCYTIQSDDNNYYLIDAKKDIVAILIKQEQVNAT